MSERGRRAVTALLAAVLVLPGCALHPAMEPRKALLSPQLPDQVPRESRTRAATLLVFAPRSRPLYDTIRMAYRLQADEIGYFSRTEWAETPAQMLQPLLAKTLQDTGFFSTVVTPPYSGPYGWGLRTEIGELLADFSVDPAVLLLSLRMQWTDGAGRVVATHEVSVREPLRQRTPEAAVAAANAATAKALGEVARFAVESAR